MNEPLSRRAFVALLCAWMLGFTFLIWIGSRILHEAFGWFSTRPSWTAAAWVAVWIVAVRFWVTPDRR